MSRQGSPEPGAGPAVERYLAEVVSRLPGVSRAQAGIVAELRSGLLDAVDAHRSAGLPPAWAALAAIREFGDLAQVADGFRAELAASQARRVAVTLLVTGPLVGLLWIATASASHLGFSLAPPWQWAGLSPWLRIGIRLVAVAAEVTAWTAIRRYRHHRPAYPLAARRAAQRPDCRCGRWVWRGKRRRARPCAARGPAGPPARGSYPLSPPSRRRRRASPG